MQPNDIAWTAGVPPAEYTEPPKGWYSRGYIPHFDAPEILQFITFRLHDSMPGKIMESWKQELSIQPKQKRENELRSRILKYVDQGEGQCYLKHPKVSELMEDALIHGDGQRYSLLSWVVMPNHVHVLIEVNGQASLSSIVQTWKSFVAHQANQVLDRQGAFWYREYYDRFIRDREHYLNVISYIHHNPVKAGLCASPENWRWSSAWRLGHSQVQTASESAGETPALPAT